MKKIICIDLSEPSRSQIRIISTVSAKNLSWVKGIFEFDTRVCDRSNSSTCARIESYLGVNVECWCWFCPWCFISTSMFSMMNDWAQNYYYFLNVDRTCFRVDSGANSTCLCSRVVHIPQYYNYRISSGSTYCIWLHWYSICKWR